MKRVQAARESPQTTRPALHVHTYLRHGLFFSRNEILAAGCDVALHPERSLIK